MFTPIRDKIWIPVSMMQKAVSDFTLSQRHFLSFPADKLEHIMRYYHAMPHGYYYTGIVNVDGEEYIQFMTSAIPEVSKDKLEEFRQKHLGTGVKLLIGAAPVE